MTKRLVDIDDDVLRTAQGIRGTGTIKATVDAGLRELVASEARRREVDRLMDGYLESLKDKGARREVWR